MKVNKINNNNSSHIAQAQLAGHLNSRLQVHFQCIRLLVIL